MFEAAAALALGLRRDTAAKKCGVDPALFEEAYKLGKSGGGPRWCAAFAKQVDMAEATFEAKMVDAWVKHFPKSHKAITDFLAYRFPSERVPGDTSVTVRIEVVPSAGS